MFVIVGLINTSHPVAAKYFLSNYQVFFNSFFQLFAYPLLCIYDNESVSQYITDRKPTSLMTEYGHETIHDCIGIAKIWQFTIMKIIV